MSFFCTECSILRSGPRTKDDVCAKCIEKRGQSPQAAPDKCSAELALLSANQEHDKVCKKLDGAYDLIDKLYESGCLDAEREKMVQDFLGIGT